MITRIERDMGNGSNEFGPLVMDVTDESKISLLDAKTGKEVGPELVDMTDDKKVSVLDAATGLVLIANLSLIHI